MDFMVGQWIAVRSALSFYFSQFIVFGNSQINMQKYVIYYSTGQVTIFCNLADQLPFPIGRKYVRMYQTYNSEIKTTLKAAYPPKSQKYNPQ